MFRVLKRTKSEFFFRLLLFFGKKFWRLVEIFVRSFNIFPSFGRDSNSGLIDHDADEFRTNGTTNARPTCLPSYLATTTVAELCPCSKCNWQLPTVANLLNYQQCFFNPSATIYIANFFQRPIFSKRCYVAVFESLTPVLKVLKEPQGVKT